MSNGMGEYEQLQASELRQTQQQYGGLRQQLETGLHRKGLTRSGFAGEEQSKLGAQEAGAIGDVQAGLTQRLMDYKMQQRQLDLMAKQAKRQKRKKGGWVSAALGAAGMIGMGLIISDKDEKKNIKPMGGPLDRLKSLDPVEFDWKHTGQPGGGVIAQDVARKMPEAAVRDRGGKPRAVDYGWLTGMLLKGYKEQQKEIDTLKSLVG